MFRLTHIWASPEPGTTNICITKETLAFLPCLRCRSTRPGFGEVPTEGEDLIKNKWRLASFAALGLGGLLPLTSAMSQEPEPQTGQFAVAHPECSFFGASRERFLPRINNR